MLLALNGSGLAAFLAGEPAVLAVYTLWVLLKSDSRLAGRVCAVSSPGTHAIAIWPHSRAISSFTSSAGR